ncbi:tetratricopeptide repeat protein [Gloeobacter morelensis]|uniref:Tetratricopeptide repeat protein n=1 Tax=Gloeobacter morelensis MG652769 TaxID=2781736 RepID=A0ABY3PMC5_9CYAN|nr:tetratricopeptide repeat protein [Gloeobacter morelensis]UFP94835.1 tetratricopeptide repeat protein [Gloeobacter morelensis MG652769]
MLLSVALRCTARRWACALSLVASLALGCPLSAWAQPAAAQAPGGELAEAGRLDEQSVKLREAGRYVEAQPLAEQALAIREKALGPEHPDVAKSLNNLAVLYWNRGDFIGAEPLHKRALTIREKALGPEHPDVAKSLNNLAVLYIDQGDFAGAEPLLKRSLAIRAKALGPEHPDVAKSLNNLANLYADRGDYAGAESLYRRALAIWEKSLGPEHPEVGKSLNNLAVVYTERGDFAGAEPLLKRTLATREKALGLQHPEVARSLVNLANLYWAQGDYARTEPLFQRALPIWEKSLGPEHPYVIRGLANLADLYSDRGDFAAAEPLFQRALALFEKILGFQHPEMATGYYQLTRLRLRQDQPDDARRTLQRALAIQEHNLSLNLPVASQQRNLAYLASFKNTADLALWLHLHRLQADPEAARLALSAALSRKGRVLEEATLALLRLRRRLPFESQQPLQRLAEARAQLAALVFQESSTSPPEQYQVQVGALRTRVRQLEDDLAESGAALRALTRPLTLQAVQQVLPKEAVLVEFVLYRPLNPRAATPAQAFGSPRYAAYVLPPSGPPRGVDLGEAKQIDALIRFWRSWLLDPTAPIDGRVHKLARLLHQKLLAPLGDLQDNKHLLIAPDGQLNTLPFAALVGEDGRALLQKHTFTYLVSGRELLRLAQAAPPPQSPALVLGGPDFARAATDPLPAARPTPVGHPANASTGSAAAKTRWAQNLRSSDLMGFSLPPLPGAAQEARTIARLLGIPATQLLTGARATENALKAARSPALLHLATHGFFLQDQDTAPVGVGAQEALLRSGVALAGFNARSSGSEDGMLTALEAQGLDLEGTELAVLSACQSGAGAVVGGEGVQGLRRALALAGTRSQVLTLWQVEDRTTAELMERFYRGLVAGLGRSEALRQAQLAVAAQPGRAHPYWWGSFAASGDWRSVRLSKLGG